MTARSRKEIEKSAQGGDADAQIELSRLLDMEGGSTDSLQWLRRAVESGDVHAKALLAKRYLTQMPYVVDEGLALLFSAAEGGDAEATHTAAVMTASGLGVERNWDTALDLLQRSAEMGFELARKELQFLAGAPAPNENAPTSRWKELRDSVDMNGWLATPPPRWAQKDPRIFVVQNFASPEICDWLIARAKPRLVEAQISKSHPGEDPAGEEPDNSVMAFNVFGMDLIFSILWARIEAATGVAGGAEPPNVLHYAVGESYKTHYDFIENAAGTGHVLGQDAQRVVTFLLYLNDDYEGRGTEFPALNWGYKGRKGDAMYFWNVDARGEPDRNSMHSGTAPTQGEKWVFSQWIQGRIDAV